MPRLRADGLPREEMTLTETSIAAEWVRCRLCGATFQQFPTNLVMFRAVVAAGGLVSERTTSTPLTHQCEGAWAGSLGYCDVVGCVVKSEEVEA